MGCDIDWRVERQRDDGSWEYVPGVEYNGRDYDLFGALAGVCHEDPVQIISPAKGVPSDLSPEVRAAYETWEDICFGFSWHTLATLLAYGWEANGIGDFRRVLDEMSALGPPDRVRAVFWFDN